MLLSCCRQQDSNMVVVELKKKKTQDSFQELVLVLGDASFDLYPGCHFLEIDAACTIQTH